MAKSRRGRMLAEKQQWFARLIRQGAGKTVAIRAAATALDPARHVIIYLANPTIGVRGMLTHIVATLGHTPAFHTARLAPQAADALTAEHAERGRNPGLVFDEVHLLDNHQVEAIRPLTNHDMDSGSPFAVVLVVASPRY